MFLDASVMVAILKGEPEAAGFIAALETDSDGIVTSPVARFEAVVSLAVQMAQSRGEVHMSSADLAAAEDLVGDLLKEVGAREAEITERVGRAARQAALRYGKVAGHPARLNMGDCFAYAMAKDLGLRLLYKGDDFAETDLG